MRGPSAAPVCGALQGGGPDGRALGCGGGARFLRLGATVEFAADATGIVRRETFEVSVTDLDSRTSAYMEKAVAAGWEPVPNRRR